MNKNNLFAWASISENGTVNGKKVKIKVLLLIKLILSVTTTGTK